MKKKIDVDRVAARWVILRHEILERKSELEMLEPVIKTELKKEPNREKKFGPHFLCLTADSVRKNFDRKRAEEKLGMETVASLYSDSIAEGYIRIK